MAMGKRQTKRQPELWISATAMPEAPGHPFYRRLNQLLAEHGFDAFAEDLCGKFYHESLGRPGIPPGVYFRMLLIGYFEGIDSERGKSLMRKRGEYLERTFAHCYETGSMRRTHLRGHPNILKRLLIHVVGFNLSLVMRSLFGIGKPRQLQDGLGDLAACIFPLLTRLIDRWALPRGLGGMFGQIPARRRANQAACVAA